VNSHGIILRVFILCIVLICVVNLLYHLNAHNYSHMNVTLAPKRVRAVCVTFICEQQCAFGWYNKLTTLCGGILHSVHSCSGQPHINSVL
jgi:hypothetical protein